MHPRDPAVPALLRHGRLDVTGRLVDASNATLFGTVSADGVELRCVYKPVRGERPLWDFPDGTLAGREVSAYLVSQATGWDLVPPTVLRDGPLGVGACQLWIDEPSDAETLIGFVPAYDVPAGWLPVANARDEIGDAYALAHADDPRLARLAVLDAVLNNADRKGGHVLHGTDGNVYGVDHGICLHSEHKLRTVLWGWVGEPLPDDVLEMLRTLKAALPDVSATIAEHITRAEIRALRRRLDGFLTAGEFPAPGSDWRAIPWPAF